MINAEWDDYKGINSDKADEASYDSIRFLKLLSSSDLGTPWNLNRIMPDHGMPLKEKQPDVQEVGIVFVPMQ